ncbi:MAG: MFS transporter [Actinomycetota bacterium]|nr:MFS transporter [Actinomycetota bacterium]
MSRPVRQPAAADQTDPPGRWAALAILAVAVLLSMTTWFSASAVVPQLRVEWALAAGQAALLTISVQLGFVVGAVGSTLLALADVVPPRRLMLAGSVGAAVANAGLVLADGPLVATPLRFATGLSLAAVYPPALKEMATWFRRGRGTALGVLVGALTIGSAAPHLVNALGGASWRLVVVVSSVLTVAGGLVAALAGRDGPFPFPRTSFDARQARLAFANRGVRLATLGYFGHMWELYAMWAWIVVFLTDAFANAGHPGRVGPAFAAFAIIGVGGVGCWVGGVLGDRWGRCRLTTLAMLISGGCALVIGLLRDAPLPLLLTVALVWGFWVVADSAQFSTVVTEVADQRYVGTALTLQLAVGFTLTVVTIYLVPVLRDGVGWQWAFAFLAPGPFLGAVAMLRLLRSPYAAQIAGGRG